PHRFFFIRLRITAKKVPPPTPDGREGRLFPPEQSWKTLTLVNELTAGGNKFLPELIRSAAGIAKEMSSFRAHRLNLSRSCLQTECGPCAFSLGGFYFSMRILGGEARHVLAGSFFVVSRNMSVPI